MKSEDFRSYEDKDEFRGPSEIITKDIALVSERFDVLKVDGQQETILATDGVFIEFDKGQATSTELDFDLDTNQGTLTKNVVANIEQNNEGEQMNIQCDQMFIDQNTGSYAGNVNESEKVLITQIKNSKLFADLDAQGVERFIIIGFRFCRTSRKNQQNHHKHHYPFTHNPSFPGTVLILRFRPQTGSINPLRVSDWSFSGCGRHYALCHVTDQHSCQQKFSADRSVIETGAGAHYRHQRLRRYSVIDVSSFSATALKKV